MRQHKQSHTPKPELKDEDGRVLFDGPQDIPVFATDEEELEFWRTHAPSDAFVSRMRVGNPLRTVKGRNKLQGDRR